MDNIRSGNLSVIKMKKEIEESLETLQSGCIHNRAKRQLVDGARFLEMINSPPYKSCLTVSQLKKAISNERNKLKAELVRRDRYIPGHQFTFFETVEEITKEQERGIRRESERILTEVRWLHKCLGICSNRDYFK